MPDPIELPKKLKAEVLMLRFSGTDRSRRLIETVGALVPTRSVGTRIRRRCDHMSELRTLREAWRQLRDIKRRRDGRSRNPVSSEEREDENDA